jgi:hypothetical protein
VTGPLVSADSRLAEVVTETISVLTLKPEDVAAARLARRYAESIDAALGTDAYPKLLALLGPKLLAALEALDATPSARAKPKGAGQGDGKPSKLAQLRTAHSA